jgi:hypothetical protein
LRRDPSGGNRRRWEILTHSNLRRDSRRFFFGVEQPYNGAPLRRRASANFLKRLNVQPMVRNMLGTRHQLGGGREWEARNCVA